MTPGSETWPRDERMCNENAVSSVNLGTINKDNGS